mgnify:FL=1
MAETIRKSTFEKDFIERTYLSVVSDVTIAFSELVANSWDAGATTVNITLPSKANEKIIIEDNGSGMTDDEFQERWMVIAYNRVAHQGQYIEYTSLQGKAKRLAYGRNGIGRHSMLCFNDQYEIETWRNGTCNKYLISVDGGDSAFSVIEHNIFSREGHGTKLSVKAVKKIPQKKEVKQTLGYRFLFDPEFTVYVNNEKIEFQKNLKPLVSKDINTKAKNNLKISIYTIPEGEKTTATNGIAFWAGGRLVGNPSWYVGNTRVEDARRKFALRHLIVVQADCLIDDVQYDWAKFLNTEKVNDVFSAVIQYVREYRVEYYRGKVSEVRSDAIRRNLKRIETLSIPALYDLKGFFEYYLEQRPEVDNDELSIIIDALVSVLQARNGVFLLQKLANMDSADIDTLNDILDEWSISDIKDVLEEIDNRLKVINAIEQLCSDPTTDELHVLHPLVSQAKWLFGIEYDNLNDTFNRQLTTVMQSLLKSQRKEDVDINWKKRPDLVIGSGFSVSSTCIEEADANDVFCISKILIIELKKGGFTIGRGEVVQAEEYIDSIYRGNKLNCKPKIKAYVVGDSVSPAIGTHKTLENYGEVYVYTYAQLVQTASKRLFNLKNKLIERYQEMNAKDYISEILNEPQQTELVLL